MHLRHRLTLTHTHTGTDTDYFDSTNLDDRSARRTGRYLHSTQQTQGADSYAFSGFEPAIPAIDKTQNYVINHSATGIGYVDVMNGVKWHENGYPSTASR